MTFVDVLNQIAFFLFAIAIVVGFLRGVINIANLKLIPKVEIILSKIIFWGFAGAVFFGWVLTWLCDLYSKI